jgi:hypothetical protein
LVRGPRDHRRHPGALSAVDRRAQVPHRVVQATHGRGRDAQWIPDGAADHDDPGAAAHEQVGMGQQQPVHLSGRFPVVEEPGEFGHRGVRRQLYEGRQLVHRRQATVDPAGFVAPTLAEKPGRVQGPLEGGYRCLGVRFGRLERRRVQAAHLGVQHHQQSL